MTMRRSGRPKHEAPEPLEGPVVATITGGTILWFVLFLVQLPFYGWFDDHGHAWWVWTCLAGAGLGLIGIWYVRRRDAAIKRAAAAEGPGQRDGREPWAPERPYLPPGRAAYLRPDRRPDPRRYQPPGRILDPSSGHCAPASAGRVLPLSG